MELAPKYEIKLNAHSKHPHHLKKLEIKVAGFGGQGVLLLGPVANRDGDAGRVGSELATLLRSGNAFGERALSCLPFDGAHRISLGVTSRCAGRDECIPAAEMADKLGSTKATNIVLLGALLEETECLSPETAISLIETKLKRVELLEINRQALAAGRHFIDDQVRVGAVTQPDGFAY